VLWLQVHATTHSSGKFLIWVPICWNKVHYHDHRSRDSTSSYSLSNHASREGLYWLFLGCISVSKLAREHVRLVSKQIHCLHNDIGPLIIQAHSFRPHLLTWLYWGIKLLALEFWGTNSDNSMWEKAWREKT
jgi:hypothetical protein